MELALGGLRAVWENARPRMHDRDKVSPAGEEQTNPFVHAYSKGRLIGSRPMGLGVLEPGEKY